MSISTTQLPANQTTSLERIIDRDLQQHIEDSLLFPTYRNGIFLMLSWNALTPLEQEAHQRATYVDEFSPDGF